MKTLLMVMAVIGGIRAHAELLNPKAKASVLVFLSAKCPCSHSHEPTLKTLSEEYSKAGIEFVGVHSNQDESAEMSKTHFNSVKLPFKVIEDPGAKIADQYKALKTPHAYIIQNGKVVYDGGVDDSADSSHAKTHYLKNALEEIKNNKPITVARARSLGCVIKR